jgi:hypothetical protein
MTTLPEANGTVKFDHDLTTDTRAIWRQAVQDVADRAKAALPDSHGRIDKAVALVLGGDVEVLGDGTARVASQCNGNTVYHITNGHCDCKDYAHAPEHWCKHRLAHALYKRAYPLAKALCEQAEVAPVPVPAPLPEAPASVNVYVEMGGRQVQLTLRDRDESRLLARLSAVLERFPLVVPPTGTPQPPQAGWCAKHGVQMRENHKEGRSWWSHQAPDGQWCKGR